MLNFLPARAHDLLVFLVFCMCNLLRLHKETNIKNFKDTKDKVRISLYIKSTCEHVVPGLYMYQIMILSCICDVVFLPPGHFTGPACMHLQ